MYKGVMISDSVSLNNPFPKMYKGVMISDSVSLNNPFPKSAQRNNDIWLCITE